MSSSGVLLRVRFVPRCGGVWHNRLRKVLTSLQWRAQLTLQHAPICHKCHHIDSCRYKVVCPWLRLDVGPAHDLALLDCRCGCCCVGLTWERGGWRRLSQLVLLQLLQTRRSRSHTACIKKLGRGDHLIVAESGSKTTQDFGFRTLAAKNLMLLAFHPT